MEGVLDLSAGRRAAHGLSSSSSTTQGAAVACSPDTAPLAGSTAERRLVQGLLQRPSAASAGPRGQKKESQAASSACSIRACNDEAKHLADMTGTVPGHIQQPSQHSAEPSQDACSSAEGRAQAALPAARAPKRPTPDAAEQGLLLRSAIRSPLPEEAQEAPAAPSGLHDVLGLLPPPASHATGLTTSAQQLPRPTNASRTVQSVFAAAGAKQSGAEQRLGELPAHSPPPMLQKPRPKPTARQAEACMGSPSSCMSAAAPGDELRPEEECVVCLDARRCVMVAPCGHWPYCVECAERLCGPKGIHALTRGEVCPICQDAVYATVSQTFY